MEPYVRTVLDILLSTGIANDAELADLRACMRA